MTTNSGTETQTWEQRLQFLLPLFGHRNWIVVADSAYPAQSNPGIETIATGENHIRLLSNVLESIDEQHHVRANVYMDAELDRVPEKDAPGVSDLRAKLDRLLGPNAHMLQHERIIAKLEESAKLFNVLILKSTLTIPYTSVFLELDCGYWNPDEEKRLRRLVADKTAVTSGD